MHEEDCDAEHNNNNSISNENNKLKATTSNDVDLVKTSKYTLNFGSNNKNNENSQLYEQLIQLKPLEVETNGVKNYKTTKNIFLNDSVTPQPLINGDTDATSKSSNELASVPVTTKTSVVISAPIQKSSSTSLKRSHQFVAPLVSNGSVTKASANGQNKYTVHFNEINSTNENSNSTSRDRDSIISNDSNDTIIEADVSSLSNLDSCSSSKRNSDFLDRQQQQIFYFNPENLGFTLQSPLNNLTRRNSMPNGASLPIAKRNSLNVTDL